MILGASLWPVPWTSRASGKSMGISGCRQKPTSPCPFSSGRPVWGSSVLYCIGSKPPPPPQQIRASHDLGLMFQLNGGRALRGTLVAVMIKQLQPSSFSGPLFGSTIPSRNYSYKGGGLASSSRRFSGAASRLVLLLRRANFFTPSVIQVVGVRVLYF